MVPKKLFGENMGMGAYFRRENYYFISQFYIREQKQNNCLVIFCPKISILTRFLSI
jgi:hypothetical protein